MKFIGLDTETTGLEIGDHRFVEVYAGLWNEDGKLLDEFNQRINPGRAISAEAQRVHKISAADVYAMPSWDDVAPKLHKFLQQGDQYVWHNGIYFDGPFLEYEFKRVNLALPVKVSHDTMAHAIWATPDGKKPRLNELCSVMGVEYDPAQAHAADYDVHVMMECFFKARAWGYFKRDDLAA